MSNITFKKQTLFQIYGILFLVILNSVLFIVYPDISFSIRNLMFFIFLGILILFLDFPANTKFLLAIMFVAFMIMNHFLYDPIQTPDSVGYYNILINYDSYGDLLRQWIYDRFNPGLYKGFVKFGIFFYPIHAIFNFSDEYFIAIYNSILMILSIYIIYKIGKKHFETDFETDSNSTTLFLSLLVIGLFASGNLYFYSTAFLKDITNLFTCLIAVYALLNKRFFLFVILFIVASYTRLYSVAIIYFYYVFVKKNMKLAILGFLGCLAFVIYKIGPLAVININFSALSLLISPNPFDLGNWQLYGLRTFETLMVTIGAGLTALLFVLEKNTRKTIIIFVLVLFSYAAIMTAVGHNWIGEQGLDYGIGSIGDNIARKKLPIIGIIYLMMTYSFVKTLEKLFIKKKPNK